MSFRSRVRFGLALALAAALLSLSALSAQTAKANAGAKDKDKKPIPPKGPKVQLYDLPKDIAETKNVAEQHPEIATVIDPVFATLTLETLQQLNSKIAVDGEDAGTVAAAYLKSKHFLP